MKNSPIGKPLLFGLMLCILMVIAPHADHLPLWVDALCISLLAWHGYLTWNSAPLPGRWLLMTLTVISVFSILIKFHTLFGREVGVTLLILLSTLKLMELRTKRDAVVLIYLSCFIIITNFLYSQSLPTALYMLATLLTIVTVWVHLQVPDSAFRTRLRIAAVLMLQAIPLMLVLFILFPRVQGPLWGLPQDAFASSGLDDNMSPGSMGRLALSDEVAFRVSYQNLMPRRSQMYWRGPVLSHFDGSTWTPGVAVRDDPPQLTDTGQNIEYDVTLEPHNKLWLFMLDMPEHISVPARLTHDFRTLSVKPVSERLRYQASSYLAYRANPQESTGQLRRALLLPPSIDPQSRQLAASWRANSSSNAQIINLALANFRQQDFHYTLNPPPLGYNGIDDFLFVTRQGFCEHYASAFVFLMRAAGIPARVVTGYQGGEYNAFGNYYIIRQSDAHAWAEVWLEGTGWQRIDPTAAVAPERVEHDLSAALSDNTALPFFSRDPPQWLRDLRLNLDRVSYQWDQWVIGYDAERQFAYLTRLGMEADWRQMTIIMMSGLGLMMALFALFMLRHLFRRETDKTQIAWLRLCRKLARAGLPRAPHEGPWDYAMRVSTARPELGDAIQDIAARYCLLRYGGLRDEQAQVELTRLIKHFPASRPAPQ